MDSFLKIEIVKNNKTPANKWSNPKNHKQYVDMNVYNCAILTGKINNIIVLDIDFKDNGIIEFDKYISSYGKPQTLIQKSPNSGNHYFFSYEHSNKEVEYLIQNCLTNKSKYRKVGIDIRSNGGYILASPSKINGASYTVEQNKPIIEMPEQLVHWLLETDELKPVKITKTSMIRKKVQESVEYDITDSELTTLLNNLPIEYNNEVSKWLIITAIMKNMNKYDIWNEWSKRSSKFNEYNNVIYWNASTSSININYLMTVLKQPLIKFHKPLPMSSLMPTKTITKKYVSECISYEEFKKNSTIIIKSCTGTGKTSMTAKYSKQYLIENPNLQILSITNLISLGLTHLQSFDKEGIHLTSYQDEPNIDTDHIYCCVNSLYKLYEDTSYFENKIVYIDEITSFIEYLTHCQLLDSNIKSIYKVLMQIVKKCHKIIVSDATINENTFNFLKTRTNDKRGFIINEFQKYKDTPAIKYNDESAFLNQIRTNMKNNEYFLFGSDWNGRVTDFYNLLQEEFEDKKDDMLLITSDTNFKVGDASEQFKNKFVFYSPSITTAVDFSIDEKQDVFIYLSGKSILPSGTFQQTTRTRNIRNLYYYSVATPKKIEFNTPQDLDDAYKSFTKTSKKINEVCVAMDENDEDKLIENTFYKLYTYNEYLIDCYESNKNLHFRNILKDNGFVLSTVGKQKQLSKDVLDQMKEITENIESSLFDEFLLNTKSDDIKFKNLKERIEILSIPEDKLTTYKDVVINKNTFENHFNAIRLLKSKEYIQHRINKLNNTSFNVKVINSTFTKLSLLHKIIEDSTNPLQASLGKLNNLFTIFTNETVNFNIDDDLFNIIKRLYRSDKKKPTTKEEYLQLIVSMIKHLTYKDLIETDVKKSNKTRTYTYSLNEEYLKHHIELDKYANNNYVNYDEYIKTRYNLKSQELIEDSFNPDLDWGIERT